MLRQFVHPGQQSSDSLLEVVPTSGLHNLKQVWRIWREVQAEAQGQ